MELCRFLVARGYKENFVKAQIRRARNKTREEVLAPYIKEKNERIPFVTTYHPSLPNIGGLIRELQPVLHCSERCRNAVPNLPMVAFRRPKNLRDYLVHAKLKTTQQIARGTVKCQNRRCDVCNYLSLGNKFTSHVTGKTYSVNYNLDCNSKNVIYLLFCKVCGVQYVGSTMTKFRFRFNNHKSRLKRHEKLGEIQKEKDDVINRHFSLEGHRGLQDVGVLLIDKVSSKTELLQKEGQWAYRLKSLKPLGLNDSDFFYSKNRALRERSD